MYKTSQKERDYQKEYYKANRERYVEYARRYRKENKEKVAEYQKKFRDRSNYHKQYYQANREVMKANQREYYKKNKEAITARRWERFMNCVLGNSASISGIDKSKGIVYTKKEE